MLYAGIVLSVMAMASNAGAIASSGSRSTDVRPASAKDSVPAPPTITLVADADKKPYVKVTLAVPTQDKSGNPVDRITKMTLYRANAKYKTFEPEEGQTAISFTDTVPVNHKSYTYGITATNKYGTSARRNKSVYVGVRKPRNPLNVLITADRANHRKARVTWQPPKMDAGNNSIDPATLTYKVSLCSNTGDITVLKDSTRDLSCDIEYTGQGYGLFSIIVNAINVAGTSSNGNSANKVYLGDPISSYMAESFANGKSREPLLYGYEKGPVISWAACNDDMIAGVTGCDNDHGYLAVLGTTGCVGLLMTNYVDVSRFNAPWVSVNLYKAPEQGDVRVQLIAVVDSTARVLKEINLQNLPIEGWNLVGADLSPLKGKLPQFGLRVLFNTANVFFHVDNIRIGDTPAADLGVGSVAVPEYIQSGIPGTISATVSNYSSTNSKPYKVVLKRNGVPMTSHRMESLPALSSVRVELPDTLSVASNDSVATYCVYVDMEGDVNSANDTTAVLSAQSVPSALPPIRQLKSHSSTKLDLEWIAPDMDKMPTDPVVETFENYPAFSDTFGPWINIDGDKRNVGGFSVNNNKLPVTGPHGFFVFDTDSFPARDLKPRAGGGKRYPASLYTNDRKPVNDWLISPELNGSRQLIEMYILAYFKFEVPWEIMYSTTGRDTTDFHLLKAETYKRDWKKFYYLLPEGTKYFAVHAVHIGPISGPKSPLFCFDDVKYIPAGKGQGTLIGYNVYCDEQLLTPTPVTATSYTAQAQPGSGHIYKVSAVYDRGESEPVIIDIAGGVEIVEECNVTVQSAVGEITVTAPDRTRVKIYNIQGSLVADQRVDEGFTRIPATAGCYIVHTAGKTFKVLVR